MRSPHSGASKGVAATLSASAFAGLPVNVLTCDNVHCGLHLKEPPIAPLDRVREAAFPLVASYL
jgi:hypothetical protein